MNKILVIFLILIMSSALANAQTTAPIPGCACNNIAAQFNLDKEEEKQTQKEIQQMDYEADKLNNSNNKTNNNIESKKTRKWLWQK